MHVLIVNQYGLPAGVPGITRHGDLGAELVKEGHRVSVLASRFNYLTRTSVAEISSEELHAGVRFVWLATGGYRGNDRRRIRSMISFTARAIWAGLKFRPAPDVVIASSPHLLAGLVGMLVARRHGVPFIFEVRDLWPSALVDLGALRPGGLAHRALLWLEAACYRRARRIITVPPHADRRVREMRADPTKCVHIPNATRLDDAEPLSIPDSLEKIIRSFGDRDLLVYTGAQGVSNGLTTVIDALDLLRAGEPGTYERLAILLVGDGGEHDLLVVAARGGAHANLRFHPPIEKGAIPSLLGRAAFLLVSFADAPVYDYGISPNKLFDYMAAARPVLLASRLSDTPVGAARAGRTYLPGSPESLMRELVGLVRTPARERAAMGARGRALVEQRYTVATTGKQLEQLLRDVVPDAP